ncbi:hypothetical protein [Nannocystis pusilla]|uniref:Secreted protein n=1 Tax=Nannocystis pusilla TaxID=889268 RepID=A0ABS7TLK8_9BACT|nr:hypothetical protein [Nannocystis pusilla]MBZ5709122.1 hypothetical protein [Nannocystis pusilla]
MSEGNRGGRWLVAGMAWCLWASACAEPEDWELTEIGADEQAELRVDEEDEGEDLALAVGAGEWKDTVESRIAAHADADGSLDGCTDDTLASAEPPGHRPASCTDHRDMMK